MSDQKLLTASWRTAVLFLAAWLSGSLLFGWYVSKFGSYNATYGTLGGVVVFMVWLYLTAYMVLVGAEVNAMITRRAEPNQAPTRSDLARMPAATSSDAGSEHSRHSASTGPASRARSALQRVIETGRHRLR